MKILRTCTFGMIAHAIFPCPESLNINVLRFNNPKEHPTDLEKCQPILTQNLSLWCNCLSWSWLNFSIFAPYLFSRKCSRAIVVNIIKTRQRAYLAKPTPRLVPLESRSILVEITCPNGFSIFSSSCSSMDSGKLEIYRLVGSCSCC